MQKEKTALAKQNQHENFDNLLLEAIDEGLSSLGEAVKTAIYFNIKKQEIPSNLNEFSNALEQVLGLGARHLEILFTKKLHVKFEMTFNWSTFEWPLSKWIVPQMIFQEYVQVLRESFEAEKNDRVEMRVSVNEYEELLSKSTVKGRNKYSNSIN